MSLTYDIDMSKSTKEAWELYADAALAELKRRRPTLENLRADNPRKRLENDLAYGKRLEKARDAGWQKQFDILRFRMNAPACVQAWKKGATRPAKLYVTSAPRPDEPHWKMTGDDGSTVESHHPMPIDEIRILTGHKRQ
jgi:hypothetical protein